MILLIMIRKDFYNKIWNLLDISGVETGQLSRRFLAMSWKKHIGKLDLRLSEYKDYHYVMSKMKQAKTFYKYRMIVTEGRFWD